MSDGLEDARAFELGDPRFAIALVSAVVEALFEVSDGLGTGLAEIREQHAGDGDLRLRLERERLDVERAILDELVRLGRALELGVGVGRR